MDGSFEDDLAHVAEGRREQADESVAEEEER